MRCATTRRTDCTCEACAPPFVRPRPLVAIGRWLNERATAKSLRLLAQTVFWWRDHHETRKADYETELREWRANGKQTPIPMPRPGPPRLVLQ